VIEGRRFGPDWGRIATLVVAGLALVAAGLAILLRNGALGSTTPQACVAIVTHAPLSLPPVTVLGSIVAFGLGYLWRRRPYASRSGPDA